MKRNTSTPIILRAALLLTSALFAAALFQGCATNDIAQDSVQDDLPLIYPNEGVGQDVAVTLYFRLHNEPYLLPVTDTLNKRPSTLTSQAVVERLVQGPGVLQSDLEPVFPPNTRVVEVYENRDTAYVTLSKELEGAEGWTRQDRYLSVCAVVNSLCALDEISRVQVMVEREGTGGMRLTPLIYGFGGSGGADFLGALTRQTDCVLTPERMVSATFERLINQELPEAYELFAQSEPGGGQKPSYAAFETQMLSIGTIESFTVLSVSEKGDQINAEAVVDIVWTDRQGVAKAVRGATLTLLPGERYKLGYYALLSALSGQGGAP